MGFESRAISAQVTKQNVTIFNKTCYNIIFAMTLSTELQLCHSLMIYITLRWKKYQKVSNWYLIDQ